MRIFHSCQVLRRKTRRLIALPRGGYGLWEATITTRDGRTFLGGGLSKQAALQRAELRLQRAQGNPTSALTLR